MKLRQIALVSSDLERSREDLFAVLGVESDFADPLVSQFGLANSVMAVGDTFIEVVTPVDEQSSAARFLERNSGDGVYMLIVQTDSIEDARARVQSLGVRTIWELSIDKAQAFHMHPKDTGGCVMLSYDQMEPAEHWAWGGPDWEQRRAQHVGNICAVEAQSSNARALATRWADVFATLPRETDNGFRIQLQGADIQIFQNDDVASDHVSAIELEVRDGSRALALAQKRGLPVRGNCVQICGIEVRMVAGMS